MPAHIKEFTYKYPEPKKEFTILCEAWCYGEYEIPAEWNPIQIWDSMETEQDLEALGMEDGSEEFKAARQAIFESRIGQWGFIPNDLGWYGEDQTEVIVVRVMEDKVEELWAAYVKRACKWATVVSGDDSFYDYFPGAVLAPMRCIVEVFTDSDTRWDAFAEAVVNACFTNQRREDTEEGRKYVFDEWNLARR